MDKLMVSACLLGCRCRYDGDSRLNGDMEALAQRYILIPVCPEQLGGLPTPRAPSERQGNHVMARTGMDVTPEYRRGAEEALRLYRQLGCQGAVLKERSPSCGHGEIYDGSFTGTLTGGDGVTAELFAAHGIPVYGESDIPRLLG